jgi:hypothetical protein
MDLEQDTPELDPKAKAAADKRAALLAPMTFVLERQKVSVTLTDPATGQAADYTLEEMNGTQRDSYLNDVANRVRVGPNGKSGGVKNFTDLQAGLLARCLRKPDGTLVSVKEVQQWPSSVQSELFIRAQDLSALGDDADEKEKAKND